MEIQPSTQHAIEHKSLAIVPSFKYLGSILSEDCSIDLEIQNRIK
jgi:hypothetical protein